MKNYYNILKLVSLFEGIQETDYPDILSCLGSRVVHYKKGQTVFQKEEEAVSVGILLSGQAQIIKEDYYGNRLLLASLETGMIFGEAFACADIKKLPVSVIATAESDIMFINYRRLSTSCTNACGFHNQLIQNMLRILAARNIQLNQKIELLSRRSIREKLMAYLSYEAQGNAGSHFTIPYNRQELADYLSVDRSALSNELCKLRDSGIIKFHKNEFELL